MRNKLINLIKQHAHEEYDNIIDEPYYWMSQNGLISIVDSMITSGCVKDNQTHQINEYNYDEETGKKIGFTCPACNFKFGINKLYQYCAKCGTRIKGWRQ